jgi:hypothetical protein
MSSAGLLGVRTASGRVTRTMIDLGNSTTWSLRTPPVKQARFANIMA